MIDLSAFGIDTQTAVAVFLTCALSEVFKKTVDSFNLKFERHLFQHWRILMPFMLSAVASLVVNIDDLTVPRFLNSWAYIFAFAVVLYEVIVRRIKERYSKTGDEDSPPDTTYPPYVTPPAQDVPRTTPVDVIYPGDGGK